jgi:hypothetical protein
MPIRVITVDVRDLDRLEMIDHCDRCKAVFVADLHLRHSCDCHLRRPKVSLLERMRLLFAKKEKESP